MNFFNILWVAYWIVLAFLGCIGGLIQICGWRGKASRAFLIAAIAGFIVFWLTLVIYLVFVPVPIAPEPRSHEAGDFLVMLYNLYSLIFERMAPALAYKVGLYCDPILYGGLSVPVAFIASFFFPPSSTPAGEAAAGKRPASV